MARLTRWLHVDATDTSLLPLQLSTGKSCESCRVDYLPTNPEELSSIELLMLCIVLAAELIHYFAGGLPEGAIGTTMPGT